MKALEDDLNRARFHFATPSARQRQLAEGVEFLEKNAVF